jgi:hypothetical protein
MDPSMCSAMAALSVEDPSWCNEAGILDLPLELLLAVCLQLDLCDLVRVAATCTRFCHGDGGLKTAELPT